MIEVRGLTKSFDGRCVLDAMTLTIRAGEVYALLGANGSGKTTLLKCVAGLYAPFDDSVSIDGLDRQRDHLAIRRFTAWLADQPFMYPHFTARRWLELVADLYDIEPALRDRRLAELLEIFDLTSQRDRKIAFLSNGQYKKLAISASLITNARLQLMDEPFTGEIDPPGVVAFKELIRQISRRGDTTVLFSTQMVDQAEQLATRIGILADGRIVHEGTADELKERFRAKTMEEVFVRATSTDASRTQSVIESFAR